jgi:hypothetical protein
MLPMNTNRLTRRIALAASVAAMGLAAIGGTAQASVGVMSDELYVTPYIQGQSSNVAVFGKVTMSRSEAQWYVDHNYKVSLKLWGEDTFSDDLLMGPYNATIYATDQGLEFHKVVLAVSNSLLNEDWGGDELYVGARFTTPTGSTIRSRETNRVNGNF